MQKGAIVGAICLATDQGLGVLAKSFFDNGLIQEVLIHKHTSRHNHYEWYPNACKDEEELFSKIDTLLIFETAWDWKVIVRARERGIKTVVCPMYECTGKLPYSPDLVICPSALDMQYYKEHNPVLVTIPVDMKWTLRKKAKVFVHNAGNLGLGGRNGTMELLEAMKYVKSPIKLIVRSQVPIKGIDDPRVIFEGSRPYSELFTEGDVFIFPEKFNGLSLPLQEAFASGMAVMAGSRFPMTEWLPNELLIPVAGYKKEKMAFEIDWAIFDPVTIAKTIDEWYNKDIERFSLKGKEFNEKNSWQNLRATYNSLFTISPKEK